MKYDLREINDLVAVHVRGWTLGEDWAGKKIWLDADDPKSTFGVHRSQYRPSEHAAQADHVLNHMLEDGYQWIGDTHQVDGETRFECCFIDEHGVTFCEDDCATNKLAICIAALRANGLTDEEMAGEPIE